MTAPLCDSRGKIRYFIGAQVDVSGLVKDCTDMESLQRLVLEQSHTARDHASVEETSISARKDEFQELSEMLNMGELETVKRWGGRMHREHQADEDEMNSYNTGPKSRIVLKDLTPDLNKTHNPNGRGSGLLSGVYQHVSFSECMQPRSLKYRTVLVAPALPFSSCSLCLSITACTGYTAIAIYGQDRRLSSSAGRVDSGSG